MIGADPVLMVLLYLLTGLFCLVVLITIIAAVIMLLDIFVTRKKFWNEWNERSRK
jgi:hypothetical protein